MIYSESAILWIILFPLIGAVINGLFGAIPWKNAPRIPGIISGVFATLSVAAAFVVSLRLFGHFSETAAAFEHVAFPWISVGGLEVPMAFRFDHLSGILCLLVTGVGSLIHLYSIGYMSHDENPQRYFSYLNLFVAAMLILILGASLPILFIGWEGVGLCSYLLIGFWFEDIEKAKAGKKAFVVNRIGDLGFLLGMFLLFSRFGTLDFQMLRDAITGLPAETTFGFFTLATLLLFVGATGKSAQIPLFVWLPDAMAGPTPVSALIHAATMVTAGVYMTCRLGFVYSLVPITSSVIAVIGVSTAFIAATIAATQNDIKKVLAYSTVSQLGYMFLAVGVGAYATAVFHLLTHAFFKALMFLGSGSVIHAMGGEQDMRKMGGLKGPMPVTFWTFLVGTLAIAGVPIFSGFFSKDEILWQAFSSPLGGTPLYILGLITAGLTATYMGRLVCLTFLGKSRAEQKVKDHLHESPWVMTVPLIILAVLAGFGGFLGIPHLIGGHTIPNVLEHLLAGVVPESQGNGSHFAEWSLMFLSVATALSCLYLAYRLYGKELREDPIPRVLKNLLSHSYYLNEVYELIFIRPLYRLAQFLWRVVDVAIIDGAVLLSAKASAASGRFLRTFQTGRLENYLVVLLGGTVLILIWLALQIS